MVTDWTYLPELTARDASVNLIDDADNFPDVLPRGQTALGAWNESLNRSRQARTRQPTDVKRNRTCQWRSFTAPLAGL